MSDDIKEAVRDRYAGFATTGTSCCAPSSGCGCGCGADSASTALGYDPAELAEIPAGADLGLGCGNPLALADIKPGETVLDLGSGAGIDCFLAAKRVGPTGHVIGVDMTPEMIARARANAAQSALANVEFRLGEIENMPVESGMVDAIISNCVINLVPDKSRAFAESLRVLAPGGRFVVSDVVLQGEIPEGLRESVTGYVACLSGAVLESEYLAGLRDAGFVDVEVLERVPYVTDAEDPFVREIALSAGVAPEDAADVASLFSSVRVRAVKPGT
ncbi:MAG: arsenite methyltransferase [Coriobacteriia bacterium]